MRVLIVSFLVLTYVAANAQSDTTKVHLPVKDNQIVFEDVVTLDSTYTSEMIYKTVKTWFVNTFNSAKAVIQSEDQLSGRFLGKAAINVKGVTIFNNPISPTIRFYIQVDVKNGKYRYRFYKLQSYYDEFDSPKAVPLDDQYMQYLNNTNKKGWDISRENYNKRADKAFVALINTMTELSDTLKDALLKAKKDDF